MKRRRKYLSSGFATALIVGVLQLPAPASATPESDAERDPAASQLADDVQISYDEALRRVVRQEKVAALATALAAQVPDKFGLLWTDHRQGGTIVINRLAADERFSNAVRQAGLEGQIRFQAVTVPLPRLQRAYAGLSSSVSTVGTRESPLGVSLDPRGNRIVVDRLSAQPLTAEQQAWMDDAKRQYGDDAVGLASVPQGEPQACSWPSCDPPLRGGLWTSVNGTDSGSFCTTGFMAQSRTDSRRFFLTSGHCNSPSWFGKFVSDGAWRQIGTRRATSYYGSQGDASLITIDSTATWSPQGLAYVRQSAGAYPTVENASYSIKFTGTANVGDYVCHTGATLGTRCGQVEAATTSTTYSDGVFVGNLARVRYTGCRGDSGGPVFRSNIAFGLHSGGTSDAGTDAAPNGTVQTCGFTGWYSLITPILNNLTVDLTAGP